MTITRDRVLNLGPYRARITESEHKLRDLFRENCNSFPKKHGSWEIFRFPDEGTFLQCDSWNGGLSYKVGSGEYSYWLGFDGITVFYFGLDGGWRHEGPKYQDNVFEFYYHKMLAQIKRSGEMTEKESKELTIELWTHLVEHPIRWEELAAKFCGTD
jgi:hypothetical protein